MSLLTYYSSITLAYLTHMCVCARTLCLTHQVCHRSVSLSLLSVCKYHHSLPYLTKLPNSHLHQFPNTKTRDQRDTETQRERLAKPIANCKMQASSSPIISFAKTRVAKGWANQKKCIPHFIILTYLSFHKTFFEDLTSYASIWYDIASKRIPNLRVLFAKKSILNLKFCVGVRYIYIP